MLVILIVCLMELIEMYANNNKMARNKCARSAKENYFELHKKRGVPEESVAKQHDGERYSMNYFYDIDHIDQSCVDQLKEFLHHKSGINSYRGMNDFSPNQPAAVKSKLIKTGLLSQQHQQAGFKPKPSLLKQPLSSINTNYILNQNINNNNYDQPLPFSRTRTQHCTGRVGNDLHLNNASLTDESLKNNVQIVLNNIQNALLNQKKSQLDASYHDRFQYLNIFGDQSPTQRNCNFQNLRKMSTSPADCDNTNNNNMGPASMLGCSFASDFTHDNSDYQWFVDYGYRDGVQHHSILSSLSASYNGIGELSYYDDLAKNLDANLAEVDMENFRSEDIHTLLQREEGGNPTMKLRLKDQTEFDNSICKSEILFSPVKESHISVDSLDMDGYADDIILTCQANKNNYTIAFEGSCMYSDDSYYDIPENGRLKQNFLNLDNMMNNKKTTDTEMTQSDAGFTTWSQLKKSSDFIQMQRYPSGNNNNANNNNNTITACTHHHANCSAVRKSSSMPNLKAILQAQQAHQQQLQNQLNVSEVATNSSQSSIDSVNKHKLPMYAIPITTSDSDGPVQNDNSSSNNEKVANPPSFNLVKLFIKQKSSSSDTCMDVSSGCWPSDSTNSSTEHPGGSNSNLNRLRKKSMNDSGKCSTLSRHEEDAEYQLDSLDAHVNGNTGEKKNDSNREIFDSPTHRRNYKDCALNIRNQMKNPLLFNVLNNNSSGSSSRSLNINHSNSETSRTSENLTQILKNEVNSDSSKMMDMITKSIQTSRILMQQTETKKLPQSHVKMVPPSFLSQLSKLGDQQQAPVYVIYPNYALPDLAFINNQPLKMQKDLIMSPLSYQGQVKMAQTLTLKQNKPVPLKRRPQSLDIEKLQQTQYSHVQDWTSLLTLLPRDYRKLLKNVPEVSRIPPMEASMSSNKPLFCMSPPIRRANGMTCDCQSLLQNQNANSSSSGGSSQPPSSGYRGSSTMLTDSEMEVIINGGSGNEAMKNMFVYQYDNVPELGQERPPIGRRGILRRTNTTSNTPTRVTNVNAQKPKRYSMLDQPKSPQQQLKSPPMSQQSQQEKRRSLQEPNFYNNGLEEYFNNIGGTKNFANRLPNYMKARDNQSETEKDLNQLMTELELNKALSNKLNYGQQQNGAEVDIQEIEARLRAESFLSSIPKSEIKHYAEVASLLEWHQQEAPIERTKLRNEVSKALSSRKVSFNKSSPLKKNHLQAPDHDKKFSTPPNSPQMPALANTNGKLDKKTQMKLEKEKQEKIQSNRFKRLQIQWELLSKDAEERAMLETKSGGTTPTGSTKVQSKIPRPVSYPNSKTTPELQIGKNLRSPARMSTPKKYTTTPTNQQTITSPTTGIPRTPNKHHTTPKKTLPVRSATRTR